MLGHLGVFASLGQQPGDVQIGLPPCLVVNFPFDGGKACWITHQAIQPLRLAFGQQPSRLVRDGGWRGCRRAVGTLTLSSSFFLVPAHLHFRLQKHFHNGLFPSCQSPVLFSLRPFAYLNTCALRCVTAFWDRTHCAMRTSPSWENKVTKAIPLLILSTRPVNISLATGLSLTGRKCRSASPSFLLIFRQILNPFGVKALCKAKCYPNS